MLTHVQDNPLGNKPVGGKTSLAGVQDKIVLARTRTAGRRLIKAARGWQPRRMQGDHPRFIAPVNVRATSLTTRLSAESLES